MKSRLALVVALLIAAIAAVSFVRSCRQLTLRHQGPSAPITTKNPTPPELPPPDTTTAVDSGSKPESPDNLALRGVVLDSDRGDGILGARVDLFSDRSMTSENSRAEARVLTSTVTGRDGSFELAGTSGEKYTIVASCDGYETARLVGVSDQGSGVQGSGVQERVVEIRLTRGSTIAGRVVTPDEPSLAEGVRVFCTRSRSSFLDSTVTDADGTFSFAGVSAGDYQVYIDSDLKEGSPL